MTTTTARERMLAALPTAERTVDVDGIATSLIEAGDGPAVRRVLPVSVGSLGVRRGPEGRFRRRRRRRTQRGCPFWRRSVGTARRRPAR